ncbi:MAG: polysaccharide deacetylase family protein [Pseudomonadota bacterium]
MKFRFYLYIRTVFFLVCFCSCGSALCQAGMVTITFDDGLINTYKYAFPILKQHNQTATTAVIYSRLTEKNDDYMTLEHVLELQKNGWEVASHSLTHKRPNDIPKYYSDEPVTGWKIDNKKKNTFQANYDYPFIACLLEDGGLDLKEVTTLDEVAATPASFYFDRIIEELHVHPHRQVKDPGKINIRACSYQREMDFSRLELEKLGLKITSYITPHNQWTAELREISKNYYACVATGLESANDKDSFDAHFIKRFVVYKDNTVNSLVRLVKENAVRNDTWVVFCFHGVGDDIGWEPWSIEKLEKFCAWLQEQKIKVVTLSEGAALMKASQNGPLK